ncbi:MAG: hypothetical protein IPN60_08685 [Saprospiraceae bacterium]|nr:hypothetical protein [Candidatus Opimibacter skivensis]
MRIKEISKKLETFINDPSTITWTKFLMESIVSLVLGLAIGFMSVSVISTSIIVSIFVIPLFIYAIILVIYKNKISLLAMLDNELKNRHYENVIILGLQISNTLFNTKQNENRVRIGRKVEEALKSCDRELGEITIDGKILSKKYINVKLNIDDLGWSLYQANKNNWVEAVDTIKKGFYQQIKWQLIYIAEKILNVMIIFKCH